MRERYATSYRMRWRRIVYDGGAPRRDGTGPRTRCTLGRHHGRVVHTPRTIAQRQAGRQGSWMPMLPLGGLALPMLFDIPEVPEGLRAGDLTGHAFQVRARKNRPSD
jgi:hypothetical protein